MMLNLSLIVISITLLQNTKSFSPFNVLHRQHFNQNNIQRKDVKSSKATAFFPPLSKIKHNQNSLHSSTTNDNSINSIKRIDVMKLHCDKIAKDDRMLQFYHSRFQIIGASINNLRKQEVDIKNIYNTINHDLISLLISLPKNIKIQHLKTEQSSKLQSSLCFACIQAIRLLADIGDYNTIIQIVQKSSNIKAVDRVFSEAIQGISRMKHAGASKLRIIWKISQKQNTTKVVRVLNEMIIGLGKKKKYKSAISLFYNYFEEYHGDEYTISNVFQVLLSSIPNTTTSYDNWQWNETCNILNTVSKNTNAIVLNNYIYGNALKINEKLSNQHNSSIGATFIIDHMKSNNILPNDRICTLLLSCYGKGYDWYSALQLFDNMKNNDNWISPNLYTYATILSVCIHNKKLNTAWNIFQELKKTDVKLNTYIYNKVLNIYLMPPITYTKVKHALSLYNEMYNSIGCDTITYNTLFQIISNYVEEQMNHDLVLNDSAYSTKKEEIHNNLTNIILYLLSEMIKNDIPRDILTYHSMLKSSQLSLSNTLNTFYNHILPDISTAQDKEYLAPIMNAALRSISQYKDDNDVLVLKSIELIQYMMYEYDIESDEDSMYSLLSCFSNDCRAMIELFQFIVDDTILHNQDESFNIGLSQENTRFLKQFQSAIKEQHYTLLLSTCLYHKQFDLVHHVLKLMEERNVRLSSPKLGSIIHSCCYYAIEDGQKYSSNTSSSYANLALLLFKEFDFRDDYDSDLYNELTVDIIKACAISGELWDDGIALLQELHDRIIHSISSESTTRIMNGDDIISSPFNSTLYDISKLHTFLLAICARTPSSKKITNSALDLLDMIENLEYNIVTTNTMMNDVVLTTISDVIAMKSYDWRLLLVTVSKSKKSKLCYNTWQYARPYIMQFRTNNSKTSMNDKDYKNLCKAFAHTLFCYEKSITTSTFSVRALQDWLLWSQRRPPLYAVKSISRLLSRCGHGSQVIQLVNDILNVEDDDDQQYETNLYILAITDLHKYGLYHYAETLYLNALKDNLLPWAPVIIDDENNALATITEANPFILDLHGMTTAVAHCAVQAALQQEICLTAASKSFHNKTVEDEKPLLWDRDMIIITGKGLHSKSYLKPVLRPKIQQMLMEEFYPPIHSQSIPNNIGALIIKAYDVNAYIEWQYEQKGLHFLDVANALRRVLYLPRWKKSIFGLVQDLNATTTH